ncbi:MAG: tRNA (adenine(22)-N(1))-methyltransferase TrmK [Rubripirellula sp.]
MPKLDERLKAVARQIRARTHVDVGSDHGHLLKALLTAGRIEQGIAIENKQQPYANSLAMLDDLAGDVRFGDGLEPLVAGEADSLSICGMGAESIVRILECFPNRVPETVLLQPNRQPELVRAWALRAGFHLRDEQQAAGHWDYIILRFERATESEDPAYLNVNLDSALLFGPWILKRGGHAFYESLREEESYWSRFERLRPEQTHRLAVIRRVIQQRS